MSNKTEASHDMTIAVDWQVVMLQNKQKKNCLLCFSNRIHSHAIIYDKITVNIIEKKIPKNDHYYIWVFCDTRFFQVQLLQYGKFECLFPFMLA